MAVMGHYKRLVLRLIVSAASGVLLTVAAADEPDVFRFEDNNRIVVELRGAD